MSNIDTINVGGVDFEIETDISKDYKGLGTLEGIDLNDIKKSCSFLARNCTNAPNTAEDFNVIVNASGSGSYVQTAVQANNGVIYYRHYDGTNWQPWKSPDGVKTLLASGSLSAVGDTFAIPSNATVLVYRIFRAGYYSSECFYFFPKWNDGAANRCISFDGQLIRFSLSSSLISIASALPTDYAIHYKVYQ